MRKPVSKHALRRAMDQLQAEGVLRWEQPAGTVVDRLWHLIEKEALHAPRKKPLARETVRRGEPVGV